MPLELMIILNRYPELTLEEAVNKLMTETTRSEVHREAREKTRKAPAVVAA